MMANAGGAWDNSKKYIEIEGAHGGKGTEIHKACVVGDTVGDPFKDTSGPALNILIKLMSVISLVIAPMLQGRGDWEHFWVGLIPLAIMLLATVLYVKLFGKAIDVSADVTGGSDKIEKAESGGVEEAAEDEASEHEGEKEKEAAETAKEGTNGEGEEVPLDK